MAFAVLVLKTAKCLFTVILYLLPEIYYFLKQRENFCVFQEGDDIFKGTYFSFIS